MARSLISTFFIGLCLCLVSGCSSTVVGIDDTKEEDKYASVTVYQSSREAVNRAIKEVFAEAGFELVAEWPDRYAFAKDGGKRTAMLYGKTWKTERMTIEPKINIVQNGHGSYTMNCEVFIQEHTKDLFSKPAPHKLIRKGRSEYRALMEKVRLEAEGQVR